MNEGLRFAEAVCEGHPDRLCDQIAARDRRSRLQPGRSRTRRRRSRDPSNRSSSSTAASPPAPAACASSARTRSSRSRAPCSAGAATASRPRGRSSPRLTAWTCAWSCVSGRWTTMSGRCRDVSDDQAIAVGHAVRGRARRLPAAGAGAGERLRRGDRMRCDAAGRSSGLGPDGKVLVVVRGRTLVGVSASVHHVAGAEWIALTRAVRDACEAVAAEYVEAGGARAARRRGLARQRRGCVRDRRARRRQRPERQEARRASLRDRSSDWRRCGVRQGSAQGRSARSADGTQNGARAGAKRTGARSDRVARLAAR